MLPIARPSLPKRRNRLIRPAGADAVGLQPGQLRRDIVSDGRTDPLRIDSRILASFGRAENHFWHFGHQKVERPFCVNRLTMPPQPAVWHFSPSRS